MTTREIRQELVNGELTVFLDDKEVWRGPSWMVERVGFREGKVVVKLSDVAVSTGTFSWGETPDKLEKFSEGQARFIELAAANIDKIREIPNDVNPPYPPANN